MATKESAIRKLQALIEDTHQCEARHIGNVPVHEKRRGETLWKGEVEIFELAHHPGATHCFAWDEGDEGRKSDLVIVLNLPPISMPKDAVKAHLAKR